MKVLWSQDRQISFTEKISNMVHVIIVIKLGWIFNNLHPRVSPCTNRHHATVSIALSLICKLFCVGLWWPPRFWARLLWYVSLNWRRRSQEMFSSRSGGVRARPLRINEIAVALAVKSFCSDTTGFGPEVTGVQITTHTHTRSLNTGVGQQYSRILTIDAQALHPKVA